MGNLISDGNVKVNVTLSNNNILDVVTRLTCEGTYREWTEDMHPDGIGYYMTFVEIDDIDEDTIEPLYNDEFEPYDENDENLIQDAYITSINKIYDENDICWEVDE